MNRQYVNVAAGLLVVGHHPGVFRMPDLQTLAIVRIS